MPIACSKWISRGYVRNHPEQYFVFGDNVLRRGYGGQAKEMRGEPNSIGIRVKKEPHKEDHAFFTDDEYNQNVEMINEDLMKVFRLLYRGKTVVFPADGIATERAELRVRAPRTYQYLVKALQQLRDLYTVIKKAP